MNNYLNVFIESFHISSFIPLPTESTIFAMKAFGGFNMYLAVAMAVAGGVLAQMLSWFIGYALLRLRKKDGWNIPESVYERACYFFRKYALFLLLLSWATLGNVLVVIAAFLGTKPRTAFPLIFIGYLLAYSFIGFY